MRLLFQNLLLASLFSIIINGSVHSQNNSLQCRIADTKAFMEKISADGVKKVDFFIIGFKSKSDIKSFISTASIVDRIVKVKVCAKTKAGENSVAISIAENGSVNDFRLMLMATSVSTIVTPEKTYEVLHLQVKNTNPFQ
jgi:hypothetical protein